jgi:hypothetical protein
MQPAIVGPPRLEGGKFTDRDKTAQDVTLHDYRRRLEAMMSMASSNARVHARCSLMVLPAIFIHLAALPSPTKANYAPSYDLDSLVFMATAIVRGTITGAAEDMIDVDISAVFAGGIPNHTQITVAATSLFSVGEKGFLKGDELYLFLVDAHKAFAFDPPDTVKMPLPAGLKMIVKGRVCNFTQHDSPGPYLLDTPERNPGVQLPQPGEFEESIKRSLQKVLEIRRTMVDVPPTVDLIPRFVLLLKSRPAFAFNTEDAIAEFVADRIANLHQPEAIYDALSLPSAGPAESFALFRGFTTPPGRDFVLKKIADPTSPRSMRLALAYGLSEMGNSYWERDEQITSSSYLPRPPMPPVPDNHGYLKRIASIAVAARDDGELSAAVLASLARLAERPAWNNPAMCVHPAEVQSDLNDAAAALVAFYKAGASDEQQYHIELLCETIEPAMYYRLDPKGGPVIAKLAESDPSQVGPEIPGLLSVDYSFQFADPDRPPRLTGVLMLKATGHEPALEFGRFEMIAAEQGMNRFQIPKGLAKGTYHVYCQFEAGGRIVGRSHGFDTRID